MSIQFFENMLIGGVALCGVAVCFSFFNADYNAIC